MPAKAGIQPTFSEQSRLGDLLPTSNCDTMVFDFSECVHVMVMEQAGIWKMPTSLMNLSWLTSDEGGGS
jgi:hypothetical protein